MRKLKSMAEPVVAYRRAGGYRPLRVGLLFQAGAVGEAVRALLDMLGKHGGSARATAAATGVDWATVKRWCARARAEDPTFEGRLEKIQESAALAQAMR